jgi:hypothetical protein
VEKWYGFIGWCGHWQWTRVRSNLYLGWPAVCTLLGEEQCGQCTRGKRNLYLGWPAVCTLLGEEQCGQWTRGKRNLYLGWPAVCWLAQIYWVRNSAGSAQEEREISTWVDLVLLSAEFAMILVTSWKNNQIFAIRKNKTEKALWCRGTQFSVRFPRLPSLLTVFRIRIHWVRIRIQHFRLNSEYHIHPDPGFSMTKRQKLKNLQLKKNLIFFWSLQFTYPLASKN